MVASLFVLNLEATEAKQETQKITQEQLDQAMAPIALYPDALLSQILMASTYPDEVTQAVAWSKVNSEKIKGDAAVKAVEDKKWNPSVDSLVAFPQVLDMMGKNPKWAKHVGDAFLAVPDKVMDTIQTLRKKAKKEGNLKSSKEQTVKETKKDETTTIIIQESSPETVYVPVYNPTYVYGSWWYSAYPPFYYYPSYYRPLPGVYYGFGAGVVVGGALWGGFNWYHRDININVNRYNSMNGHNKLNVSGDHASWKNNLRDRNPRAKEHTRNLQRDNAKKALNNKGVNLSKERKNISGVKGDKLRQNINKANLQKYDFNPSSFIGISAPNRSKMEARRGDFSRSHSNGIGSNHNLQQRSTFDRGNFDRSSFGSGNHSSFRSGGMGGMGGGRMHMRRR